jgi:hypothetical protein
VTETKAPLHCLQQSASGPYHEPQKSRAQTKRKQNSTNLSARVFQDSGFQQNATSDKARAVKYKPEVKQQLF